MSSKSQIHTEEMLRRLERCGIARSDAESLRRISMTLNRWFELECGSDRGAVERDEVTGKTYWVNSMTSKRSPCADRETPALKRLGGIMARYPGLGHYIQGDCRGASLYILRPGDVPEGKSADSYYSNGIAVYK